MKYLLDVNVLLAAVWANHPQYAAADAWLNGKSVVVCPISELGFLRVSTNRKAIAAPMEDARKALEKFLRAVWCRQSKRAVWCRQSKQLRLSRLVFSITLTPGLACDFWAWKSGLTNSRLGAECPALSSRE